MLFSVPDSLDLRARHRRQRAGGLRPEQGVDVALQPARTTTAWASRPDGEPDPNGTDFWWDDFAGSRGNCWYRNTGAKDITVPAGPAARLRRRQGPGDEHRQGQPRAGERAARLRRGVREPSDFGGDGCPWFKTPPEPGAAAVAAAAGAARVRAPGLRHGRLALRQPRPARPAQLRGLERGLRRGARRDPERHPRLRGRPGHGRGRARARRDARRLTRPRRTSTRWCSRSYAQGFLLYKLYTHAAAFTRAASPLLLS